MTKSQKEKVESTAGVEPLADAGTLPEVIHVHVSPAFIVHSWMGLLKYRHSARYHAKNTIPVTDPIGHCNEIGGNQILVPQVPHDEPIPTALLEAEALKQTIDSGQSGRAILDYANSVITRPNDSYTSSGTTAINWRRGKTFGGKITA
jgi:hypothetical protein